MSRVNLLLLGIVVLTSIVAMSITEEAKEDLFKQFDEVIVRRVQALQAAGNTSFSVDGLDKLRVASFGSSITYGHGLENRTAAYPYLVSNHTDNYAMLSGGPNFPAVCAQTLIGRHNRYDVILFEYWLNADQGLLELAVRLRRRFAYAIFIAVKIEGPTQARRKDPLNPRRQQSFEGWRDGLGLRDASTHEILQALNADNGVWFFPPRPDADHFIKEVHDSINLYRVRLPIRDTAKETLAMYLHWFHDRHTKLAPVGHAMIADMIRGTIENKMSFASVEELMAQSEHVGSWGFGDDCRFWATPDAFDEDHSDTIQLTKLHRFNSYLVLSVNDPGNFTVTNHFANERTLYITYLTSTDTYQPPVMEIRAGESGQPFRLDPTINTDRTVLRTKGVGVIPPGRTHIYVDLIDKVPGADPPRIMGVTITDETVLPREFAFSPPLY